MFGEVTKEIKAQLYERVRSPLLATFLISWTAWNFRAVLVLFSTASVEEKLRTWGVMYPGVWESLPQALVYPALTGALFLLAYPYPARWAFHYWHWQHRKLKEVQQRIDDETPMTQEEAKELRRTALEQQAQMQGQLRSLADVNRELANQREALLTQLAEAHKKASEQAALASDLEAARARLQSAQASTAKSEPQEAGDKNETSKSGIGVVQEELSTEALDAIEKMTTTRGGTLSAPQALVLYYIVKGGGRTKKETIYSARPKTNRVAVDHAIDGLASAGLIVDGTSSVVLTDVGRELAVKSGLTRAAGA